MRDGYAKCRVRTGSAPQTPYSGYLGADDLACQLTTRTAEVEDEASAAESERMYTIVKIPCRSGEHTMMTEGELPMGGCPGGPADVDQRRLGLTKMDL